MLLSIERKHGVAVFIAFFQDGMLQPLRHDGFLCMLDNDGPVWIQKVVAVQKRQDSGNVS